jgi:hypothetical protein
MNNLKNFVDSNVRHRIDRVTLNSGNNGGGDLLNDDLILVERHFDGLREFCVDMEKKISNMLQSIQISSTNPSQFGIYTQNVQAGLNNLSQNLAQQAANISLSNPSNMGGSIDQGTDVKMFSRNSACLHTSRSNSSSSTNPSDRCRSSDASDNATCDTTSNEPAGQETNIDLPNELNSNTLQKYKKLPIVGFYKALCKSSDKLKQDSILATTLKHCSRMQAQLTNLYLIYEQMIDIQCLKQIQLMLEVDIPNVSRLKKQYIKAHHDYESIKARYNGANQKQQQLQAGHPATSSYLVPQGNSQQGNSNKLESLKNELDESITRLEQAKVSI